MPELPEVETMRRGIAGIVGSAPGAESLGSSRAGDRLFSARRANSELRKVDQSFSMTKFDALPDEA